MQSLSPDQILTFGRHKGKSIEYVAEYDPSWLLWALRKDLIKPTQLPTEINRSLAGRDEEQLESEEVLHELFPDSPEATATYRKVYDHGKFIGARQRTSDGICVPIFA